MSKKLGQKNLLSCWKALTHTHISGISSWGRCENCNVVNRKKNSAVRKGGKDHEKFVNSYFIPHPARRLKVTINWARAVFWAMCTQQMGFLFALSVVGGCSIIHH